MRAFWSRWGPRAGLLPAVVFLTAWLLRPAGPSRGSGGAAVPVVPPARVAGDVTVWSWNVAAKSLQAVTPGFHAECPNVDVHVVRSGTRLQTRFMLSLASGVGAPDVSQFQMAEARQYIATRQLADLTPVAAGHAADFPPHLWKNCVMDGKVYAIPWDMGPCAVFYKREVFRRYGLDPERIETWDDYIRMGRTLVRRSGGRARMLPLGANTLTNLFLIFLQQTGGQIFDDEGRIAVASPEARRALDILQRLRASGIGADVPQGTPEYISGLNGEGIATYPGAVWLAGTIKDTAKDAPGRPVEWGVFRLPAVVPGGPRVANLGGSVLVIPAQCPDKAAAWAYLQYALCTRAAQARHYANYDLFPAYLPALKDPAVRREDAFFGGQRVGDIFARDVTQIRALNMPPGWNEAAGYLDQALSRWSASGTDTAGFLDALALKMSRRLDAPLAPSPVRRAGTGA